MIRRVKYNEIDFEKYTKCLENSEQRKYSASRTFLDVTTNQQWDILVKNDYEAVMPVPFIYKNKVKIVHNPMICQQLGVFSAKDDQKTNERFLQFLKKNYLIRAYYFNETNCFDSTLKTKKNFLLYPDDYAKVFAKYSPKRKRKLRLDDEVIQNSEIREVSYQDAEVFIKNNAVGLDKENDIGTLLKTLQTFYSLKYLKFSAFYYHNEMTNMIATYSDFDTVALLGTFNDKKYIKMAGASTLIDQAIKENIEHSIFDFEGGNLPSIEEFFRGFRAELKPYTVVEHSIKKLLKDYVSFCIKGKILG
ncbi:hypothetical protein [Chryseobacterium kwangjuense]|uniref:BioF2-like acetyltransferase domain-containing protein n=1 Tax=Chryseobacterium kwangjuense TaxID=267125 RepID=A0A135W7Y2_9FLAO|nr:hypothetical protein [Chryseobacterium kwangjuense]KXH81011.1 hypothetical protein AU378_14885 [Chryseobacterium kwangjuense]